MEKLCPDIILKIMHMLQNRLLVAIMEAINLERGNWSITKWNNKTKLIILMVGSHKYFLDFSKAELQPLYFIDLSAVFLPLKNYFLVIFPFKCSEFMKNLFYICYHGNFQILGYFWMILLKDVKILLYFGNELRKMKSKAFLTKIRSINFGSDFGLLQ